jgi:hypothetical protein
MASGMKPATRDVLTYLQRHGSITPMQALNELGCYRLGARIWELRDAGYPIDTETVSTPSGKHFAKYVLIPEAVQMVAFG